MREMGTLLPGPEQHPEAGRAGPQVSASYSFGALSWCTYVLSWNWHQYQALSRGLAGQEVINDLSINVQRISTVTPKPRWPHQWRILSTHADCLYDLLITEEPPEP